LGDILDFIEFKRLPQFVSSWWYFESSIREYVRVFIAILFWEIWKVRNDVAYNTAAISAWRFKNRVCSFISDVSRILEGLLLSLLLY
jgi:hypothetical protein